jgi:hypothetical protein
MLSENVQDFYANRQCRVCHKTGICPHREPAADSAEMGALADSLDRLRRLARGVQREEATHGTERHEGAA